MFNQGNRTDREFIEDLAATAHAASGKKGRYRLSVSADQTRLIWRPLPLNASPKRVYTYYTENDDPSLIDFSVRSIPFDPSSGAHSSVEVVGKNLRGAPLLTARADNATATGRPRAGGGKVSLSTGEITAGKTITTAMVSDKRTTQEDLQARADNEFSKAELDVLEADLTIIMDPHIRRGWTIEVRNVSRYSGSFLVRENRVTIDESGARQTMQLTRNGAVRGPEFAAEPMTGQESGGETVEDDGVDETVTEIDLVGGRYVGKEALHFNYRCDLG